MQIFQPADSDVNLNVRRINEDYVNPNNNKVFIKAAARQNGTVNVDADVDIDSGTDVQIRIGKNIFGNSKQDPGYAFASDQIYNVVPICVVKSRVENAKCDPGTFPQGTSANPGVSGWNAQRLDDSTLLLKVPKLDNSTYKYNLFFTRYDANGGKALVKIDPRIKNGDAGLVDSYLRPASFSPAGMSGNTLFLLAILLLAAGVVMGWSLAGGRRA